MSFYGKVLEKINVINCIKKERGAIFVLTALLLPIMFGCLGIAYDVGTLYMHKARLQNVADAAALAGGRAYLQSQTKVNGKDSVDGTMDYRSKDIANCTYKGGRSMTVKYEYGKETTIDRGNTTQHPDADAAADTYIFNNIVNLGNTVYADKYSHFALNYGNATSKIFYRIGLYETVPLRFLPIITDKYSETVRAGAIAYVEPGTTTTNPGSGDGSSTITHSSIFDNLFTYSVDFFSQNIINNSNVKASYEGDIVYTHMNSGSSNGTPLEQFFYYANNPATNSDTDQLVHLYTATGDNVANPSLINDPQINPFYNTEEYMSAFKKLLLGPHYDITTQEFTLKGNHSAENNRKSCLGSHTETSGADNGREYWYIKTDRTFYRIVNKDAENKSYACVTSGNEEYKICYVPYPSKVRATDNLILCGKKDNDSRFYLLKTTGPGSYEITDKYIGEVLTTTATGDQWGNVTRNTQWSSNTNITLDEIKNAGIYTWCDSITLTNTNGQGGNVYHVTRKLIDNPTGTQEGVQNITIYVDAPLEGDVNEPIYIIVDDDICQVQIKSHNSNVDTRRPVIVVYSANTVDWWGQVKFDFAAENGNIFRGTLYMPYTEMETSNFQGTFRGNIIAKHVKTASGQGGHWIQQNYLDDVNADIKAVSDAVADRIKEANKKMTDAIKDRLVQAFDGLQYEVGNQTQTIHVTADNLGDMTWYNNLTYKEKKLIYGKWKELYDGESDSEVRNLLWPWNEHFNIESGSGGTVTTPESLRLINFRTEYRENGDPEAVVDPFIYMTLGNPLAY